MRHHPRRAISRAGFLNFKVLVFCLLVAGVAVYFILQGDGGIPKIGNPIEEIQKGITGDKPAGRTLDTDDPVNGPAASGTATPPVLPTTQTPLPNPNGSRPNITPPIAKKTETPVVPPVVAPTSPQSAALAGKWLTQRQDEGHTLSVEWRLEADGSAIGLRSRDGTQISRFPFRWQLKGETFTTEMNGKKAEFQYRSIDANSFELTVITGVSLASGQSRMMTFKR